MRLHRLELLSISIIYSLNLRDLTLAVCCRGLVIFHFDEDEPAVSQALVATVILVAQVGEYMAELLLGQDGLVWIALATGVVKPHAPCCHQPARNRSLWSNMA